MQSGSNKSDTSLRRRLRMSSREVAAAVVLTIAALAFLLVTLPR